MKVLLLDGQVAALGVLSQTEKAVITAAHVYPSSVLAAHQWEVVDVADVPLAEDDNPAKYEYVNGTVRKKADIALAEAKDAKLAAIDALRDAKNAEGVPYTFPDGQAGTIQTRDIIDARNIQANAAAATVLAQQGVTDPVMMFRDQEDRIHYLTPQQMLDMGLAVMARGQAIYATSWTHKDAVAALTTVAEVEAYDITQGWPV
jgi:hypothetical protein